ISLRRELEPLDIESQATVEIAGGVHSLTAQPPRRIINFLHAVAGFGRRDSNVERPVRAKPRRQHHRRADDAPQAISNSHRVDIILPRDCGRVSPSAGTSYPPPGRDVIAPPGDELATRAGRQTRRAS